MINAWHELKNILMKVTVIICCGSNFEVNWLSSIAEEDRVENDK